MTSESSQIHLSICIPTYNRARFLEEALMALEPQIQAHHPQVELIVSDNCSPDHTTEVVKRFSDRVPLTYHRNTTNEGFYGNIFRLTDDLARGEFVWIVGDDDIVRSDGVARVLNAVRNNPDVDYFFVNADIASHEARLGFDRPISESDITEYLSRKSDHLCDYQVEKWEYLLDPEVDDSFLVSIMTSVFRLSRWKAVTANLTLDAAQRDMLHWYLHAQLLAKAMLGRKAYFIGQPSIIAFWGGQEWIDSVPYAYLVMLQDLLDAYKQIGVDPQRVERCRRYLLEHSHMALKRLLLVKDTPQRDKFSLRRFLYHNRGHPLTLLKAFYPTVYTWLYPKVPKPIIAIWRSLKRTVRSRTAL